MNKPVLIAAALAAAFALAWVALPPTHSAEGAETKMSDLKSVDELKAQFNADAGKRRLLLLLSPT